MPKRNLAWILVIVAIALLMWQLPQTIAGRDSVFKAFGPLVEVRSQIHKRYVGAIDDDRLVSVAVNAGIEAMMESLEDPYAGYFDVQAYSQFQRRAKGDFGDIGVDVWSCRDGLEVLSREHDSPATEAGILPGDVITHVDGTPVRGLPLVEVVNTMLRGAPGTELRLTVVTPGLPDEASPRELTLRRTEVHLSPIRGWSRTPGGEWRHMLDPKLGIGYLRLTKFTQKAVDELDAQVEQMERTGMKALVLDLRDNTGGLLSSAIDVADRFLDEGLIVRTSGRRVDGKQWFATRERTYGFPLAVLVNDQTASAAEIVAGALRDHRRAAIVGERTYGKGSVQEVVELDRQHGAIKLTTAYYYLPGGHCIHRTKRNIESGDWGVAPTAAVAMTDRQRQACLDAWRELSRERTTAATDDSATRPTSTWPGRAESLKRLLSADVQLNAAFELLESRLHPGDGLRKQAPVATRP